MATKTAPAWHAKLKRLGACPKAIEWAKGYRSARKAWQECHRGDWMLWLCGRYSGQPESAGRKKLVLCACECARLSLPIYEKKYPNDNRVRNCIEVAERWAKGKTTIEELREARSVAHAASGADYGDAYVSACVAYIAADVADVTDVGYGDADVGAYVSNVATYVLTSNQSKCAAVVRKHYPSPPGLIKRKAVL